MKEQSTVQVFDTPEALAAAAAEMVRAQAQQAIGEHGSFNIALSGGSTPARLFAQLRRPVRTGQVDWRRVHVFWADERCVPANHPDSNYGMAQELLLHHVPCPVRNVHRMKGERAPNEAADAYDAELREALGAPGRLDLVLLGMGADGHTASLFPGTKALAEKQRWCRGTGRPCPGSQPRASPSPIRR